jgi:FkbM family methyltransferase
MKSGYPLSHALARRYRPPSVSPQPSPAPVDTLRLLWNRLLGRETLLDVQPMGTPLVLSVRARREIRRARSIAAEAALVGRMLDFLAEGDVIYDVGSNIGIIGLILARNDKGTGSRVYCFEPEPRNFEQLRRNIALNSLGERVQAYQIALGDREGEAELFVRGGPGEGRHSLVSKKGSTGSIRVAVQTGLAFSEASGDPPDLIKVDVEGAEGRVLAGMEPLVADRRIREIFLELHDKGDRDRMPTGETIDEWLAARGYRKVWEHGRTISRHCHFR